MLTSEYRICHGMYLGPSWWVQPASVHKLELSPQRFSENKTQVNSQNPEKQNFLSEFFKITVIVQPVTIRHGPKPASASRSRLFWGQGFGFGFLDFGEPGFGFVIFKGFGSGFVVYQSFDFTNQYIVTRIQVNSLELLLIKILRLK